MHRSWLLRALLVSTVLWQGTALRAQQQGPLPLSCDQELQGLKGQIDDEYRRLVDEHLLSAPEPPTPPITLPSAQFAAIRHRLRVLSTQYLQRDEEANRQAREKGEQIALWIEQVKTQIRLREDRDKQIEALQAELAALKPPQAPLAVAPKD